jgi:hypothetical protein
VKSRIPTAQNTNHLPVRKIILTVWERAASVVIDATGKMSSNKMTKTKYMRPFKSTSGKDKAFGAIKS